MLGVATVFAGLAVATLGGLSLAKPLVFLRIRTRRRGLELVGAGLSVVLVGMFLPAPETRLDTKRTLLDDFAPRYQFSEIHEIHIGASRDQVYRAVTEVTADEILFFQTLTWIRRLGRTGPESILNAPEHLPLLEVATRTSFVSLAEDPGRELLVGVVVLTPAGAKLTSKPTPDEFKALDAPGFAKATMNFRLGDTGSGECLLTTETRVYATDASARRRFAAYWRVIYPGSSLIRRMWLRAIKLRAQAEE